MSEFGDSLRSLASKASGSYKTVHDRIKIVSRFEHHLRSLNIQIRAVSNLKAKHIESYIKNRLEKGINLRSLQNEMAALRATLHQAG